MNDQRQILVIDDEADRLSLLESALREKLIDVPIVTWQPTEGEDPVKTFLELLDKPTGLIVTDHDLTKGIRGLLGSTITAWSQERFIPVCNFSRKPLRSLPRESNFFELRVPSEPDEGARAGFISKIYQGFQSLRAYVFHHYAEGVPAAALLAGAMGDPSLEDDLAPYITSVGSSSSSLLQNLREADELPKGSAQVEFHTFILGHVLVNAVLKYAGPIMSRQTLAAYCAFSEAAQEELARLFSDAEYRGPFSGPSEYFVRDAVDERIDQLVTSQGQPEAAQALEVDEYNHAVVQQAIGLEAPHACGRCDGTRGGLWCPFTQRAICNREDCSVSSATWIPRGATLCRVEHDYYDEWAPLLGE